jgi:hypothetical protein
LGYIRFAGIITKSTTLFGVFSYCHRMFLDNLI